ncbi:hypothetical protein FI667_g8133, partial [Globisporangium splendens]
MTPFAVLLALAIGGAVLAPFLYIVITWDHELVYTYGALPAPSDLGTKEFAWRCWLSSMTRTGWRKAILRSPCPRITLQCPFALLSTDFAKLTTSLGFQTLALEKLPFIFPQVATSSMLLQLLGNSNFPVSVRNLRVKALTITQLRPLDMRFRDKTQDKDDAKQPQDINCVMVLTEKRFLEKEVEFTVQTDLLDDQGTLWQSVMWLSVPYKQETLLVPLSNSGFQIDAVLEGRATEKPTSMTISCTSRNFAEFAEVAMTNLGSNRVDKTPLLWMLGQVTSILQREERVPVLPLMCSCSFDDEISTGVALNQSIRVESFTNSAEEKVKIVKFAVTSDKASVMHGLLRTVGWTFMQEQEGKEEQLLLLRIAKSSVASIVCGTHYLLLTVGADTIDSFYPEATSSSSSGRKMLGRLQRRAAHRRARHAFSAIRSASSARPIGTQPASVLAFADGASRGNPGKSGCGALLLDATTRHVIASGTSYLGENETNNSAEYKGLLLALRLARTHDVQHVHVHMDSELIVRQMQGVYRVKAPNLRVLHNECRRLCDELESVAFSHVRREENAEADRLANQAIDDYDKQKLEAAQDK